MRVGARIRSLGPGQVAVIVVVAVLLSGMLFSKASTADHHAFMADVLPLSAAGMVSSADSQRILDEWRQEVAKDRQAFQDEALLSKAGAYLAAFAAVYVAFVWFGRGKMSGQPG